MLLFFQTHFEDPDKVVLPSSLVDPSIVVWKRPNDPTVADAFDKMVSSIIKTNFVLKLKDLI